MMLIFQSLLLSLVQRTRPLEKTENKNAVHSLTQMCHSSTLTANDPTKSIVLIPTCPYVPGCLMCVLSLGLTEKPDSLWCLSMWIRI